MEKRRAFQRRPPEETSTRGDDPSPRESHRRLHPRRTRRRAPSVRRTPPPRVSRPRDSSTNRPRGRVATSSDAQRGASRRRRRRVGGRVGRRHRRHRDDDDDDAIEIIEHRIPRPLLSFVIAHRVPNPSLRDARPEDTFSLFHEIHTLVHAHRARDRPVRPSRSHRSNTRAIDARDVVLVQTGRLRESHRR